MEFGFASTKKIPAKKQLIIMKHSMKHYVMAGLTDKLKVTTRNHGFKNSLRGAPEVYGRNGIPVTLSV